MPAHRSRRESRLLSGMQCDVQNGMHFDCKRHVSRSAPRKVTRPLFSGQKGEEGGGKTGPTQILYVSVQPVPSRFLILDSATSAVLRLWSLITSSSTSSTISRAISMALRGADRFAMPSLMDRSPLEPNLTPSVAHMERVRSRPAVERR